MKNNSVYGILKNSDRITYGYSLYNGIVKSSGSGPFEYTAIDNTYSMEFDGTSDYMITGLDLSFASVPNFSISYWIKTDATLTNFNSYFAVAVNVTYAGGAYNYSAGRLYKNPSGLVVYVQGSGSAQGTTALDDGNWHHIVQVYTDNGDNTSRVRIYVDGNTTPEVDLASTLSFAPLTSDLFIGARNTSADRAFPGYVDEVAVWNTDISEGTIEAIYNTTNDSDTGQVANLLETPEGVPVAWYRFE